MHRAITRVLAAASVLLITVGANPGAAAAPPPDLAVFEWYRLSQANAKVSEPRLSTLRTDGFKTVYASVGEYLEVADQPPSRTQQTRLNQLKTDLKRFVARASSLGVAVHAVGGGPNWTDATHRYLGPKPVQLVADYNGTAAGRAWFLACQVSRAPPPTTSPNSNVTSRRRSTTSPPLPRSAPTSRTLPRRGVWHRPQGPTPRVPPRCRPFAAGSGRRNERPGSFPGEEAQGSLGDSC
jgi:hypothetical protein